MSRSRLLVTRSLPEPALQHARELFELKLWPQDEPIGANLKSWAEGCSALLVMATDRIDRATLDALRPHLRALGTYSVGYDHIDLAGATERGIPVFHTPDVLSDAVAEIAMFLILSAARDASTAEAVLRGGTGAHGLQRSFWAGSSRDSVSASMAWDALA